MHSSRSITPAQRGQAVQRILVEGWSTAEAALHLGVSEGLVDAWVVDFRRNGMASLRRERGGTLAAQIMHLAFSRPVQAMLEKISNRPCPSFPLEPLVQPLPVRRSDKDGTR